jgi:hypothetical protein
MDKLQLKGQTQGRVFNSRNGCMKTVHLCWYEAKLYNLKLKTWPKQLLGSLPIDIALPAYDSIKFIVQAHG